MYTDATEQAERDITHERLKLLLLVLFQCFKHGRYSDGIVPLPTIVVSILYDMRHPVRIIIPVDESSLLIVVHDARKLSQVNAMQSVIHDNM